MTYNYYPIVMYTLLTKEGNELAFTKLETAQQFCSQYNYLVNSETVMRKFIFNLEEKRK